MTSDDEIRDLLGIYFAKRQKPPLPVSLGRLHVADIAHEKLSFKRFAFVPVAVALATVVTTSAVALVAANIGASRPHIAPPVAIASPTPSATALPTATPASATPKPIASPTPAPTPIATPVPTPVPPPTPPQYTFADNFDQDALSSTPDDAWVVDSGGWSVVSTDSGRGVSSTGLGFSRLSNGSNGWTNYYVSSRVSLQDSVAVAGVLARYQDASNYYMCKLWNGTLTLGKQYQGTFYSLASTAFTAAVGSWYTLGLKVSGSDLACDVIGGPTVTSNNGLFPSGRIGLLASGTSYFDDVTVK